ncbi:hypothetical protein BKA93DRAFT_737388, partial [Sparassis latifolia]
KEAAIADKQTRLDPHLKEKPVKQNVVLYTDALFHQAALEWLIATDQPIHALEHPAFHNMINIAVLATNGVNILNHKRTCKEIIETFKRQLTELWDKLNVGEDSGFQATHGMLTLATE